MSRAGDVTPREAWDVLTTEPGAVLVDVRTRAEWTFVGVPDLAGLGKQPVLLEWNDYPDGQRNPRFLDELAAAVPDRDVPVLFLCRSGVRSVGASDAAADAGWSRAFNVLDGFEGPTVDGHRGAVGWRADGLPWSQP
ncbi:Rhodanese-related sulfurtransferase [Quadrisphaera granulorum]|uniref:Rhodanese-related sulfurtransferase n=1 Tax=Quadrisphaera granulorum TaxID=317664 RepID=A0A315ZSM2_9ACTN|nr:rhodanese-like domain-containing protein [Quadrisphaera granulorum]PWJ48299.1 rhodanese-related sulfurtransferase [Quadrisphaera granulorum]SZE98460.1 Rhodanese-related sulfurtransferase [Quadrisphaera granulorum]